MSDAHEPIPRERRFVDGNRCPICGGSDNDARGCGIRCHGFYSGDGLYAHCAREEKAGGIEKNSAGLYAHRINAPCKCGREHDGTPPEISDADVDASQPIKTEIYATYDYVDEQGRPLRRVLRYKQTFPDGRVGKTFSQSRWENEKWIAGVRDVRQVLYHLPDVLKAPADEPIYVVEGEKCVEALCDKGYTATCNAGGAGKWKAEHVGPLKGKHVVVLPDNDKTGQDHALKVATSLHGIAATLKVINLPGLPPHGDIADAIEARGDAALNEMVDLVDEAPLWTPPTTTITAREDADESGDREGRKNGKQSQADLAQQFVAATRGVFDRGAYYYPPDPGAADARRRTAYRAVDEAQLRQAVYKSCHISAASQLKGVVDLVLVETTRSGFFDEGQKAAVAFADGVAVAQPDGTLLLRPYNPQIDRFTWALPWDFTGSDSAPAWEAFMAGTMAPDSANAVEEFMGVAILGEATRFQKALLLKGPGQTGKSIPGKVARGIVEAGGGIVAAVSPADMGTSTYRAACLCSAVLNIVDEVPKRDLVESAEWKSVVAGAKILVERKFQHPFNLIPRCGHVLASNAFPATADRSTGFFRRFLVVLMERVQSLGTAIEEKILAEREAVSRRWLKAGARALARGGYSPLPEADEMLDAWRIGSDQVYAWMTACAVVDASALTAGDALWESYRSWCVATWEKPLPSRLFLKELGEAGHRARKGSGNKYRLKLNGPAPADSAPAVT